MNNSRISTFVLAIAAAAGIILGVVALSSSMSNKKAMDDMKVRLDNELGGIGQIRDEVRSVASQTQNRLDEVYREVYAIRDGMSNAVARAVASANAPKSEPAKAKAEAGAKKDKAEKAVQEPKGPGTFHAIAQGDTFGRLAKQYGTTPDAIEKLNPGVNSAHLKLGQKIRVK